MKEFFTVFAVVFLAELGDKTQLAAMGLSASAGGKWAVFAGASFALVLSTAMAVLFGDLLFRRVDPILIRRAAGALFIVLGILLTIRA